ncbi:MAG: Undecaprenyl-phosphate mannosyltransferase [Candidatus Aerophobetes bacterium ADurb.Bin490]|nr:MAG: Undecaprenyl-phosphate mannosyltransferase [Candidatus Aerophobetes bacterium ADurb.Bin490]HPI03171.1 glycosyltransferase family 2 protein [Candidatus Goldiibacteriota bacterium]HPN64266.1 glycosyltransferase family 2 protein [Candidatus Goldiibacteriota bacterium]HRQ43723.1 glycosyltransferase family 2 protein [Candidatus Goldiibacteriota bacterium]
MKLVINIPCLNEEKTLPLVLSELPKKLDGIDTIIVQIVDDGSSDNTSKIAMEYGARVIRHEKNLGLGTAFKHGMEAALEADADIMVNTDADNQYPSRYIKDLIKPVIDGRADMVIGNRTPWKISHFSGFKRFLQYFGNMLTRKVAGSATPDTVSGFRAYSKEAMLRLNITTKFSYVLDTIVQAERKNLNVASVPIETNTPLRRSRLFKNILQHVYKSGRNLLRCYIIYEPFMTFMWLTMFFLAPAMILLIRFLYFYVTNGGAGHIQSLVISSFLFALSGIMFSLSIIAEIIGMNRTLIEEQIYLKKKEFYQNRRR